MRLLIATCLCLATSPVSADEVMRLPGIVVAEAEQDRTLISKAGWLRGLHVLGTELPELTEPRIQAFMPAGADAPVICARITSQSGDYSAMVQFDVPEDTQGGTPALLEYDPKSALATAYTPETGGVAVERGPCEGATPGAAGAVRDFYVSFWNQAAEPLLDASGNATLVMHINVSRADSLTATAALEGLAPVAVPCAKLNDPIALAYNFECRILLGPGLLSGLNNRVITFEYQRVYRGDTSRVRRANLHLGAPNP